MDATRLDPHPFLTAAEVGDLLKVQASTVVEWSRAGKLRCVFTSSGRPLYLRADILTLHPELVSTETAAVAVSPAVSTDGPEAPAPARAPARAGTTVEAAVVAEAVLIAAEADAVMVR